MRDEGNITKVWDSTRRTIESFDSSIAESRKNYLTLIGVILSVVIAIVGLSANQKMLLSTEQIQWLTLGIGTISIVFTIIFWGLDTHYHSYLKVAAATAERIELQLELYLENSDDPRMGVSHELGKFRSGFRFFPKISNFIYFIPGVSLIILMTIICKDIISSASPAGYYVLGLYVVFMLSSLFLYHFSDWRTERFIHKSENSQLADFLFLNVRRFFYNWTFIAIIFLVFWILLSIQSITGDIDQLSFRSFSFSLMISSMLSIAFIMGSYRNTIKSKIGEKQFYVELDECLYELVIAKIRKPK